MQSELELERVLKGSKKGAESWWEEVGKEREKWDWKRFGKEAKMG